MKERQPNSRSSVTMGKPKPLPAHVGRIAGPSAGASVSDVPRWRGSGEGPTPPPPPQAPPSATAPSKNHGSGREKPGASKRENWANLLKASPKLGKDKTPGSKPKPKPGPPPPPPPPPPPAPPSAKPPPKKVPSPFKRRTAPPDRHLRADDEQRDDDKPIVRSPFTAKTGAAARKAAKRGAKRKGRPSLSDKYKSFKAADEMKRSRTGTSLRERMKRIQGSLRNANMGDDDDATIGDDISPSNLSRAKAFRYPKPTTDGTGSVAFTRERAINRGEFEDKVKALTAKFRKKAQLSRNRRNGANGAQGLRGSKRPQGQKAGYEQRGSVGKRTSTYRPYEPED